MAAGEGNGKEESEEIIEGNGRGKSELTRVTTGSGVLVRYTDMSSSMDDNSIDEGNDGAKLVNGDGAAVIIDV